MKRRLAIGLLLVGTALLGVVGAWLYGQTRPLSKTFQPQLVRLRAPTDATTLAQRLYERRLIRNPRLLAWWLHRRGKPQIAAGDYEFSPSQSLFEIADILVHERFTRNWVTIPEGWTMARIAERLHERGVADKEEFLALCRQPQRFKDIDMPLPKDLHLEGYLFPSTYRLPPGTGAERAIRTMLQTTRRQVYLRYRDALQQRGLSLHELLTIASMIEKEVLHDDERPRVASVIYNRLRRNMPLQIDATVLYGLGYWKARVLYKDLRHPSPYNTYLNRGLPPGPIANPGLASIRAALNPEETEYLFYVAQADGYHRFSRTYEEHLQAIRAIRAAREPN
ncbi:MAG: endolytic transglycosylase MltG [Fimbriimonadales bacterium]|nr:endolytic transglycosylase MltG [Fimbriimonadales bacterium]